MHENPLFLIFSGGKKIEGEAKKAWVAYASLLIIMGAFMAEHLESCETK